MPTIVPVAEEAARARLKEVFEEIKSVLQVSPRGGRYQITATTASTSTPPG